MIVKSLSRRDASFTQLIGYLTRKPDGKSLADTQAYGRQLADNLLGYVSRPDAVSERNPAITQNLGDLISPGSITDAFKANAALLPRRKNGVVLYHEILSFNERDTPHLSYDVMAELTRKYLELRAPNAIAYARPHFDTTHRHVHIMLSANDLGSNKRNWMTRTQFREIKDQLESFQRSRYPELTHSLAQSQENKINVPFARNRFKPAQAARAPRPTNRQALKAHVLELLSTTENPGQFMERLEAYGFRVLQRGDTYTLHHIASNKRFRLKTLDLLEAYQQAQIRWQRATERLDQLQQDYAQRIFWPVRELLGTVDRIARLIPSFDKPLSRIGKRFAQLQNLALNRLRNRSGPDRDR